MTSETTPASPVEVLSERLFDSFLGALDVFALYLGDRLGYYQSLADDGPATPEELAARTASHPRYAREWLEQQAMSGLVEVVQPDDGVNRRFGLSPAMVEVTTDRSSLNYLGPLGRMFAAIGPQLPHLVEAYRTGGGVSWEVLGEDARESQADLNRPWYEQRLAAALGAVSAVDDVLDRDDASVLDIGCGGAWSTIPLARAHPRARFSAVDIDEATVEMARSNVREAGLEERITVRQADAVDLSEGSFDLAFAFECVHDMPRPVEVLAAVRRALKPGAGLVVMDEAVGESFDPAGEFAVVDRLMYGFSLGVCLPDSMSTPGSVATGTVMRRSTLEAYAREAGFTSVEVLPIEGFGFWRFYRLV